MLKKEKKMRKFKAAFAKKYTDGQGQEKTSWKNIGFANEIVSQDGKVTIHLTLDSIPTGTWDGEVKLFLQDENNQGGGYQQQQSYQQPQQQSYQQPQQAQPQQQYQPSQQQSLPHQ